MPGLSAVVKYGDTAGAILLGVGGYRSLSAGGTGPLQDTDSALNIIGGALSTISTFLDAIGRTNPAYYAGLAGVVTNIAAYEVARSQMAQAEAEGDRTAYAAALSGAIGAAAGAVAGKHLPTMMLHGSTVLRPMVRC